MKNFWFFSLFAADLRCLTLSFTWKLLFGVGFYSALCDRQWKFQGKLHASTALDHTNVILLCCAFVVILPSFLYIISVLLEDLDRPTNRWKTVVPAIVSILCGSYDGEKRAIHIEAVQITSVTMLEGNLLSPVNHFIYVNDQFGVWLSGPQRFWELLLLFFLGGLINWEICAVAHDS